MSGTCGRSVVITGYLDLLHPQPIELTSMHDITEILLKVVLHPLTLNIWSKWWISGLITYFSDLTPLFRQRNIFKNLYLSVFVLAYLKITFYYFSLSNMELVFWYYPSIDSKLGTGDGWQGPNPHNCSARPPVADRGTPSFLVFVVGKRGEGESSGYNTESLDHSCLESTTLPLVKDIFTVDLGKE